MILFVSFSEAKASEIYSNTGYGFQLKQSLDGEFSGDIALSHSGSKLICEVGNEANLYEAMHGKYSKVQTLAFTSHITCLKFSDDEKILLIGLR